MIKKLVLFCGLMLLESVWALEPEEVTVQELSSSGKSVVIDRGLLEEMEEGIFGQFYVQKGPKEFPKIFLVAEGELIKSFPKKSYWMLKKIHIPHVMLSNSKILLVTSKKLLSGRTWKVRNRHLVSSVSPEIGSVDDNHKSDKVDEYLEQNGTYIPSRMNIGSEKYQSDSAIFSAEELNPTSVKDSDLEVTTYENFKKSSGTKFSEEYGDQLEEKYFIGGKEIPLGDIKKMEDKKIFDSINKGQLAKVKIKKFGIKDYYKNQEKVEGNKELNKEMSIKSLYEENREAKQERSRVSPMAIAKMRREGDQWSAAMDDDTLRRYFIQTGLESEVRRRSLAISELDGHELLINYSGGLGIHANAEDPNYQGRGYALGLAYDFHLSRISTELKQWSLELLLEESSASYSLGSVNGRSNEMTYGTFINYYFINNPLALNSFNWLVGMGIKNGTANISAGTIEREYSYQLLVLPAFQLMGKYRFRTGDLAEETVNAGLSLNFGINLDMKNLSVQGQMDDDIDSKISVSDLKYTAGMSIYF